ncbi:galactose-1-phosphate uridylyltransferase [Prauserella muralis]|uniref:Galactose-1-phosphate uridylyltransferase n=1 Tax=Prauserella muralis TaxID=588067 RepID=A0A2V4AMU5_9PSEU|nr:galactose-1-phosphate uridylyltransferase [Prauserella muralis]PXY21304.1 galactose-1-phosphate uridylyltransferase [Prauserella muralis]TWE30428.1 UDPglucose--hexose-1-phosphate uridylyltransferase [Prauserella muralis]
MKRTTTTLADGRELLYFTADDGGVPDLHDPRRLPMVSTTSQLRLDPLLDEWVMMAAHRQNRTHLPPEQDCPLCPSSEGRWTEIPAPAYSVAIFENRQPSLSMGARPPEGDLRHPLVPVRAGLGRCEVVCFTSDHHARFADLSAEQARLVVDAWADRTEELAALDGVKQVFCFENRGPEIGVTLAHPHGQIYAYPFVTPRTRRMREVALRYRGRTGRDLHADVVAAERSAGLRLLAETAHWVAFVPAAARWPVEVHLYPLRRVKTIPELTDAERDDFATVYLDVLRRCDRLYDAPLPYVSAWHQGPVSDPEDLGYLHLQLFSVRRAADKLKYLAGSESGMNAFVTDVLPEDVARRLREA